MKLAFVSDPASAYLTHIQKEIVGEWSREDDSVEVKALESMDDSYGNDLFGESPLCSYQMETKADIEALVAFLEGKTSEDVAQDFSNGLVVLSSATKNATKKLAEQIKRLGGSIYVAEKTKLDTTKSIVNELNLTKECKDFLVDYVGEEYQNLIALIESISDIPARLHPKITVEHLEIRLPHPPGEIPLWKLEDPLVQNNSPKFFEYLPRILSKNGSEPMVSSYLLNRLRFMLFIKVSDGSIQDIQALTGLKGYPLKKAQTNATKFSYKSLSHGVEIMTDCDRDLKGGSRAPKQMILTNAVLELFGALHQEK